MPSALRSPRTIASPGEAIGQLLGVARRLRPLADAFIRGGLDADLRERVMVAVSRINACGGCVFVHERLASRAGVTSEELEAIGIGHLGPLDARNRAAVAFAVTRAETRFRRPVDAGVSAEVTIHLRADEVAAIEAVARLMTLANLSVNTTGALLDRLRRAAMARIVASVERPARARRRSETRGIPAALSD